MSATIVTQNACKLCAPLGAALAFKGIEGVVPLLHGSQGCPTYIRRYLISHFREPVDIASSNFSEEAAVFGGASNLKTALDNLVRQYQPQMIGVATTCLAETIGDDVPGLLREYAAEREFATPTLHVSTPSYKGSHSEGFHATVLQTVEALTRDQKREADTGSVNLFPGMLSPADLRHLKDILGAFELTFTLLPDYSQTLDGAQWDAYQKIPPGGTSLESIHAMKDSAASLEFGQVLAENKSAGKLLNERFGIPCFSLGLPIGVQENDLFFAALEQISGRETLFKFAEARGRLIDAYVDGHKYVSGVRAAIYGEEDLVVGLAAFLAEIGIQPVLCASGGKSGNLHAALRQALPNFDNLEIQILDDADFQSIGAAAKAQGVELLMGNSKGYQLAREMKIPLVRVGFPIHDRFGGARILHVGYDGTQNLFDQVVNAILENRQGKSEIGYSYM
jgi:nitrogenase molybdenum-iron protein NifN